MGEVQAAYLISTFVDKNTFSNVDMNARKKNTARFKVPVLP